MVDLLSVPSASVLGGTCFLGVSFLDVFGVKVNALILRDGPDWLPDLHETGRQQRLPLWVGLQIGDQVLDVVESPWVAGQGSQQSFEERKAVWGGLPLAVAQPTGQV